MGRHHEDSRRARLERELHSIKRRLSEIEQERYKRSSRSVSSSRVSVRSNARIRVPQEPNRNRQGACSSSRHRKTPTQELVASQCLKWAHSPQEMAPHGKRTRTSQGSDSSLGSENSRVRSAQGTHTPINLSDDSQLSPVGNIQIMSEDTDNVAPTCQEEILEVNISDEVLNMLGDDPRNPKDGKLVEFSPHLVPRWANILANGLGKNDRASLLEKYAMPTNCPNLKPPELNPEVLTSDH